MGFKVRFRFWRCSQAHSSRSRARRRTGQRRNRKVRRHQLPEGHETCGEKPTGKADPFGTPLTETHEPDLTESKNEGYTQAAGHVPFGVTDFMLKHTGEYKEGTAVPDRCRDPRPGRRRTGSRDQPRRGAAVHVAEFRARKSLPGFFTAPTCKQGAGPHETGPESTVIGEETATVYLAAIGKDVVLRQLFNLVPPGPPHARSSLYGAALKVPLPLSEGLGFPAGLQVYAHTAVEGNVEWGKEAKGTGAGDYHDYFEVNVSPSLPLIRSRQLNYGTAGNGAFITNATACPGHHTTRLSLEGVHIGSEAEITKRIESGELENAEKGIRNADRPQRMPACSVRTGLQRHTRA